MTRNDRDHGELSDGGSLCTSEEAPAMEKMQLLKYIGVEMRCAREAREAAKNHRTIVRRNCRTLEGKSEIWI